jgi:hypothetical protein
MQQVVQAEAAEEDDELLRSEELQRITARCREAN